MSYGESGYIELTDNKNQSDFDLETKFWSVENTLNHQWGLNHFNPKARGFERSPHEGDTGMTTL